jgi:hypothetical protein
MKTRNNVQKAITKSLAVIISLVLISITVNAQDFWRTVLENNSFNQIALAMVDNTEVSSVSVDANSFSEMDTYAEFTFVETEEALEIENWMTNENNFFASMNIETEVDEALEVEGWMTKESLFDGTSFYLEVETEEALEIENWMTETDYFGVRTIEIETETENSLELEAWMTDNKVWKM